MMGYLEFVLSLCKQTLAFVDFLSFVLCFVLHYFAKVIISYETKKKLLFFLIFFCRT